MKTLIFTFLLLFNTGLAAQEKFTYYMMTTSNSPSMKITEPLVNKLREIYEIDWKQNVGCAVKSQVDKETRPIFVELVTGQYWMSLYEKNNNCIIDMSKIRWIMLVDTTYKVCVKVDSNITDWNDLLKTNDARFAYTTGTVGKPLLESLNKDLNAAFRPVILTNSNAALTALLAKDVDVAFLNVLAADTQISQGNIRCIATTEKDKENSLSTLSPKTNKLLTNFALGYAIGVKNVTDDQFKKIVDEMKILLPNAKIPNNVKVSSIKDMSEKELRSKVDDATINLYEATK
jgi:tripartite-type tricarboxylate transporter receptor subunit TctC